VSNESELAFNTARSPVMRPALVDIDDYGRTLACVAPVTGVAGIAGVTIRTGRQELRDFQNAHDLELEPVFEFFNRKRREDVAVQRDNFLFWLCHDPSPFFKVWGNFSTKPFVPRAGA
jgi:hypothetical protein